jgi:integral membrane protein (TIGR01906 family)
MKTEQGSLEEEHVEPAVGAIRPSSLSSDRGILAAILFTIVAILAILAIVLTAVRILLTPAFVQFEYRTPNFPADPYGFTRTDRLYWSQIALNYLLNDAGIGYLGDLRFQDGSPVYNNRELGHMVDVKNVVQVTLKLWYFSLAGLLVLGGWAWIGGWWRTFRRGLWRGGWLTIILVGLIIFLVLLSFGAFFVGFHEVFFDPGTWTFLFSDTLIRLFPERFWRDAFLTVGILSVLGGLTLALLFRPARNTTA